MSELYWRHHNSFLHLNKYQLSESISSKNYKSGVLHKVSTKWISYNNYKSCAVQILSSMLRPLVPCAVIDNWE